MPQKLVVVGDGASGKTCLLTVFSSNEFPEFHVPTIFDTYIKDITINNQRISLSLYDTAGEEDYDRLRPLSYRGVNVVLICFAIDSPDSLYNVKEKWWPEISHFLPDVPYILVGNKLDLRNNPETIEYLERINKAPVSKEDGERMARRIDAHCYMECSAKHLLGIRDIFEEATIISFHKRKKKLFNCTLI